MIDNVFCFLPCRRGSERVPLKNTKPFVGFEMGLLEVKLKQLSRCEAVSRIYLSTNDEAIVNYAENCALAKILVHRRDEALASSEASTDSLVRHARELIPNGHILWTHVTSPFLNSNTYTDIVERYFRMRESGYDSLMTVTSHRGFFWTEEGPLNYDRGLEKWPRTQTLPPLYEINSGVFLAHRDTYEQLKDRIGKRPYLYELDKITGFDIDWPEDFLVAESLAKDRDRIAL